MVRGLRALPAGVPGLPGTAGPGPIPATRSRRHGRADRSDEVSATLQRFGLDSLETWNFGGADAQRLRYEIDPRWYGEMPRTYFYAGDGSRTPHSGALTLAEMTAWLGSLAPQGTAR